MFRKMMTAAFGALAISQAAFAEVHTYEFTANVNFITLEGATYDELMAWDLSQTIALGDRIVGRFSFDDASASWRDGTATQPFEERLDATMSFRFERNGLSVSFPTPTVWARSLNSGFQSMTIGGLDAPAWSVAANLFLANEEAPGTPYPTDPTAFNIGAFNLSWSMQTFSPAMRASVQSLTEVSPVPEPATYGMVLVGLVLVGAAARQRIQRGHAI